LTTNRTRTTRPLRSTPITRASPLLRGDPPPCPASVRSPLQFQLLGVLPSADRFNTRPIPSRRGVPTFHTGAQAELAPPLCRTTTWPASRHPPGSSQGNNWTLVSVVVHTLTTGPRWFTRVRLLGSHLTHHVRLFRNAHDHGSFTAAACGGLRPPPAWAVPEGPPPSPVQHRIQTLRLLHRDLLQRSWHTVVGIPHQDPQPPMVLLPRPVKAVQHHVGEQGASDSSHAVDNQGPGRGL
jgi:hypothetical protein